MEERTVTILGKTYDINRTTHLKSQFTNVETLPDSIGNLTNMKELTLSYTKLQTLPDSIGKLTNLVALDLHANKLQTLPDSIGNLTNLGRLDLNNNNLQTLPDSIGKIKNPDLKINVGYNKLIDIPNTIPFDVLVNVASNHLTLKTVPPGYIEWFRNYAVNTVVYYEKRILEKMVEGIIIEDVIPDVKTAIAPVRRFDYKSLEVRQANESVTRIPEDGSDETKKTIGDLPGDALNTVYSFLKNKEEEKTKAGKRTKKTGGKRTKKTGGKRTKKNSGKHKRKTMRIKK